MEYEKGDSAGMSLAISVKFRDVREGDDRPDVHVYAFNSNGVLFDQRPVSENGQATVGIPKGEGSVLILLGPAVDGPATLSQLRRLGATEKTVRIGRRPDDRIEFEVWRPDWQRWILNVCCVHGHVYKRVGDFDLPVCDATVEVYEVDPLWIIIQRLPDRLIDIIKEIALQEVPRIPDPIGPISKVARVSALGRLSEFLPNPDDPDEPHGPGSPVIRQISQVLTALPERVLTVARSGSVQAFRQELQLHAELLRPIFCWFHPRWVTRHKVGQGITGCDGRFNVCFYHSIFNQDRPDLWFRVTQNVPPHGTVVIYERFPVSCYTWWNHDCSSEVNLYTTNPLAYTCSCDPNVENPGNWVLMDAIGATFAAQIRGMSLALQATTTSSNIGQTGDGRPFAGRLDPILYFSPGLTAAGVQYRVSYQKDGTPGWTVLTSPIARSYLFDDGGTANWGSYPLGPTGELYRCRPANPPQGNWEVRYYREDRAATFFDTMDLLPALDHGLYRLKFEIFRNDGTPLPMADPALGFDFLVGTGVPGLQDPAWPALLDGDALVVPVFVDKRMCVADIAPPTLGGATADPECGGLTFTGTGGTVQMPYTATHPGGFFTFSWSIVRGAGNPVAGLIYGPGMVSATVANMIGTCSDGAAFAINLNVYGTAQDGYSRLGNFDASDALAFMLIKS